MGLTNYAKDRYVSQHLSELTRNGASELSERPDQSAHWVANFVLNSTFRHQVESRFKQFAFVFLRRAEMAYVEYDLAGSSVQEYIDGRSLSAYFRALYHYEALLAQAWQAYEYLIRVSGKKAFEPDDDSPHERLNRLHNQSKHFEASTIP